MKFHLFYFYLVYYCTAQISHKHKETDNNLPDNQDLPSKHQPLLLDSFYRNLKLAQAEEPDENTKGPVGVYTLMEPENPEPPLLAYFCIYPVACFSRLYASLYWLIFGDFEKEKTSKSLNKLNDLV